MCRWGGGAIIMCIPPPHDGGGGVVNLYIQVGSTIYRWGSYFLGGPGWGLASTIQKNDQYNYVEETIFVLSPSLASPSRPCGNTIAPDETSVMDEIRLHKLAFSPIILIFQPQSTQQII